MGSIISDKLVLTAGNWLQGVQELSGHLGKVLNKRLHDKFYWKEEGGSEIIEKHKLCLFGLAPKVLT